MNARDLPADTPVEAAKSTMARALDLANSNRADLIDHESRIAMLERSDRTFKVIAVTLLLGVFGGIVWCGTEFHALAQILVSR